MKVTTTANLWVPNFAWKWQSQCMHVRVNIIIYFLRMKMQAFVRLLARGTSNFVRLPCHEHVKTFVPVVRVPARLLGRNQTNQSCLPSCWINLTKPQSSTIPVLRLARFPFLFSEYYSLLVALFVFFALFSLRVSFSYLVKLFLHWSSVYFTYTVFSFFFRRLASFSVAAFRY